MRARKIDTNQPELVKQMRKLGMTVFITSMVGQGYPDLSASIGGKNFLFEVKNPANPPCERQLTPDEQHFFDTWKGQVDKVETIEDVLRIINKK